MIALSKAVEWTANTFSIVAAVVVVAMIGKSYVVAEPTAGAATTAPRTQVGLRNLDWTKYDATVVLALSVGCRYCTQSAPFYRELHRASLARNVRIVSAFPQTASEGAVYLRALQVPITDIRQTTAGELQIQGTPTLLIVDKSGRLVAGWIGALSPAQEAEVFQRLQLERSPSARLTSEPGGTDPSSTMTAAVRAGATNAPETLLALTRHEGAQPIVDIRERVAFSKGHLDGATNIPLSELETRAVHELPRNRPVFVYCRYSSSCEVDAQSQGVVTYCALAEQILHTAGLTQVRVLSGDLHSLQRAGHSVVGDIAEQP